MKGINLYSSIFKSIGLLLGFVLIAINTTAQSTVIDLQYNPMSFTNANKTILVNNGNAGKAEGSVHKYSNVVTISGVTVYAKLTILEVNGATISNFDDDTQTGDPNRFQPRINPGNNGGNIVYQLEFFNTANDQPVFLKNYYVTGVDVDGSSSYQEYAEISGFESFIVDQACQLVITSNNNTGRTRFRGITTSLGGVTFDNTASWMANFTNPNNVITFALGVTDTYNNERYFSVQFGAEDADGPFDNPVVINNPLPIAVDDVGTPVNTATGGTAVPNILDNDLFDGNTLTTNDVNISIINPASNNDVVLNTSTGEVTVAAGTPAGDYEIDYQICMVGASSDCDIATIFVSVIEGPTAVDDNATADQGVPVTIDILDNDTEGSSPLDPTTVTLDPNTAPDPATEGTFTVDPNTGQVTFTPVASFSGTATIDYEVCDENSLCSSATISVEIIPAIQDTDGDGCPDDTDDYPNDPDRCFNIYYPADGNGTLAYEDLWPGKGDYDFNDLVLDYRFKTVTNASNRVVEIFGTFTIKAFGAALENGFGFQFATDAINQTDITATGYDLQEDYIDLHANGLENGQSKPTFILYDNAFNLMPHPGAGIGVNTTEGAPYVNPVTLNLYIDIADNQYTYTQLDIANFNPFIIVDMTRSVEVHLPDFPPTDLADDGNFGTYDDDSNAGTGRYYKTENNLPWAINITESFAYPKEKIIISDVYNHFVEWAESGGTAFPDWFMDKPGYRNESKIFQIQD